MRELRMVRYGPNRIRHGSRPWRLQLEPVTMVFGGLRRIRLEHGDQDRVVAALRDVLAHALRVGELERGALDGRGQMSRHDALHANVAGIEAVELDFDLEHDRPAELRLLRWNARAAQLDSRPGRAYIPFPSRKL